MSTNTAKQKSVPQKQQKVAAKKPTAKKLPKPSKITRQKVTSETPKPAKVQAIKKVREDRYKVPSSFLYDSEVVSWTEAKKMCNIDAPKLCGESDKKLFVSDNVLNYYILVNTWLFQFQDMVSLPSVLAIKDYMMVYGVIKVISDCNTMANALIEQVANTGLNNYKELDYSLSYLRPAMMECAKREDLTDIQATLQLLRYPKRFSPCHAELLKADGLRKFAIANSKCRVTNDALLTCTFRQAETLNSIKRTLAKILKGYKVTDFKRGYFSSGVAADASRPLADKLDAYSQWVSYLHHPMYPLGSNNPYSWPTYGCAKDMPLNVCKVTAVPKSFKTVRIIAEEDAYRQFHMQCIREALSKAIWRNGYRRQLDLNNQDGNREACLRGSASGCMATIDLSSASDTLSRELVRRIMPEMFHDVLPYLPSHCDYPNPDRGYAVERRKLHMFCTAGAATTFVVESLAFLAICIEATAVASVFQEEELTPPRVFGDDMLVDYRAYETTIHYLENLGFIVNQDKSYGVGPYRESCGVEYVYGIDVSSKYFPREVLSWKNDANVATSLSSLCALQHRLYSCFHVSRFLTQLVKKIEPRMTSHDVGSDCADLWHTFRDPQPTAKLLTCRIDKSNDPVIAAWISDHRSIVERYRHLAIVAKTRDNTHERLTNCKLTRLEAVELWLYVNFLVTGPTYATKLDRALGVSEAPASRSTLCNSSVAAWDYVIE